jgi:hypothetical protein
VSRYGCASLFGSAPPALPEPDGPDPSQRFLAETEPVAGAVPLPVSLLCEARRSVRRGSSEGPLSDLVFSDFAESDLAASPGGLDAVDLPLDGSCAFHDPSPATGAGRLAVERDGVVAADSEDPSRVSP